ncbi:DUF7344 domain-containing protein [Haloprofundus salilacus]|uniref:DUF7344 domain-containing protein n=1 Tax=Haloprofundus salilacus TaxID=2876190 RepID=UPI001CD00EDF|nr:hypothetical protein [Haloprofundus salilacus]
MSEPTVTDYPDRSELDADGCDELFDSLAAARRRAVLLELAERGGPLSIDDLTRALVERRDRRVAQYTQFDETTTERVERLRIDLYHVHLPKLAAADLVAFDHETRRVSTTERTSAGVDFIDELQ